MFKLLSSRKWAGATAFLWTLLIFILCLWPGEELPKSNIALIDKWVHFVLFAPFTFLWLSAFGNRKMFFLIAALIVGIFTGFLVEMMQAAFPKLGRSYDLLDIVADGIGSLLGVLLFAATASFFVKRK